LESEHQFDRSSQNQPISVHSPPSAFHGCVEGAPDYRNGEHRCEQWFIMATGHSIPSQFTYTSSTTYLITLPQHVIPSIMQVSKLCLLLLAYNHTTEALVIPIRSLPDIHPDAAFVPTDHRPWSKQDVLTFVGVCVAIVTAIIGLVGVLVASPNTRKWLCRPFDWFTQCWPSSKNSLFLICLKEESIKAD
jgi:hypothetical protein